MTPDLKKEMGGGVYQKLQERVGSEDPCWQ